MKQVITPLKVAAVVMLGCIGLLTAGYASATTYTTRIPAPGLRPSQKLTGPTGINFASQANGASILNPNDVTFYGPLPYHPTLDMSCTGSWSVNHILCPNDGLPSQTYSSSAATTWSNSGGGARYVIIDLGRTRVFNVAYFYQANSDGRTTFAEIAVSDTPQGYAASGWKVVTSTNLSATDYTGQRVGFPAISGRYVRLGAANTYASYSGYVELHGLQLFYE